MWTSSRYELACKIETRHLVFVKRTFAVYLTIQNPV